MGLFGKSKKDLLIWQNIITNEQSKKLYMSQQQLQQFTEQQASNDLRIINDCTKIISETVKPDIFFSRMDLMKEKAYHLLSLEPYIKTSGASITSAVKEIEADEQKAIFQFLVRYFTFTLEKADSLKTDKGKKNQYQKFYSSLQLYYDRMNSDNVSYIETKYNAYIKDLL